MKLPTFNYDYLIVGCGLFGSTFAHLAKKSGKRCLVIDKRSHVAGNIFTNVLEGIPVHQYGAHIFHTSNKLVWDFVNQFVSFNNFVNSPIANYKGQLFNLPFNMNTFYEMWGITTPSEAHKKIQEQRIVANIQTPKNLEEQAISLVGTDIYQTLIKGYTEKQWGKECKDLPASIINRLPVRLTFDNNYFKDRWQGIPIEGYTRLIELLLDGIPIRLGVDFFQERKTLSDLAQKIIFTGPIDAFFNYCYGPLEYRSLRFETEILPYENYQGVAVMNYTDREVAFTRIIEHKHFVFGTQGRKDVTVISREYPDNWDKTKEPYYPVNNDMNSRLYDQYVSLSRSLSNVHNVIFGGRLGAYKYYDMDKVIEAAFSLAEREKLYSNT